MSLRVPADATTFEVPYGFFAGAYEGDERTDGATFSVLWADGSDVRLLATRTLDPDHYAEDRGLLTFSGPLPPSTTGRARLLLHTGAGKNNTKDWTCWGRVNFAAEAAK
jgi:hypothetical protein